MTDLQKTVNTAMAWGVATFQLDATSRIHGVPHWTRVWSNAVMLNAQSGRAQQDLDICAWFAFLHDCKRVNDNADPEHGRRAAAHAVQLWMTGQLVMEERRLKILCHAIEFHSAGLTKGNIIARICWDADRLDLPRVGISLDPLRMATRPGRNIAEAS